MGLRQCIRPLVESATPGHDGFRPLSSLFTYMASRASTDIRFKKRRIDRCAISIVRQQTWQETHLFSDEGWGTPRLGTDQREVRPKAGETALCICSLSLLSVQSSERPLSSPVRALVFARRSEPWTARTVLEHGREGKGSTSEPGSRRRDQNSSIHLVFAQDRPCHPDQLVRQRYNRHILVSPGQ